MSGATVPSSEARRTPLAWIRRFAANRAGVGAVEFAIVAPFLFLLYLGGSEISIAVTINRKVEHTASTLNDLITQAQALSSDDLRGIYELSTALIVPYDAKELKIRVTSVYIDKNGVQKVDWSCPTTGWSKVYKKGDVFALPAAFATLRDRYLLVAETSYPYTPITGYGVPDLLDMGGTSYLDPRIGANVVSTGCSPFAL